MEARHRAGLLECLDLEPAGESYDELGADFTLAETAEGWLVLVANGYGFDLDEALGRLSAACGFALGAEIVEAASFSRVCAFRDGARAWTVSHDDAASGDGLRFDGEPPAELTAIRERVADGMAASGSAGHAFDAPIDLAAGLVGYRAGEGRGLEWITLQKRDRSRPRSARRPKSLRAAMVSELLPFLRSLGWDWVERPDLTESSQIYRELSGTYQTLWFEYASGAETYIEVHFGVCAASREEAYLVLGHVGRRQEKLPLWRRFTWQRFVELTRYTPPPEDRIGAALDQARHELQLADDYLRTGVAGPCIRIEFERQSELWPPRAPNSDKG